MHQRAYGNYFRADDYVQSFILVCGRVEKKVFK